MKNLIVVYGGKSVEHDISIITALQAMENVGDCYNIVPVYITKNGEFISPKDYKNIQIYSADDIKAKKVEFFFAQKMIKAGKKYSIDCILCCCHGINGEDGTISALANLLDVPYVGSDILSSAICMDKVIMKDVFVANDIPCVKYKLITNLDDYVPQNYPVIIKPANLGSSIGISIAKNIDEYKKAVKLAFLFDNRVIVENCLVDFIEINCSALKDENEVICSELEQPSGWKEFLKFDDKYLSGQIKNSNIKKVTPNVDKQTKNKIQELTKKIYRTFNCSGVIRVDFMVDGDKNVYANEINSIPGSLAFYLWKDLTYQEILKKLISNAQNEYNQKSKLTRVYKSSVLNGYKKMNKYSK